MGVPHYVGGINWQHDKQRIGGVSRVKWWRAITLVVLGYASVLAQQATAQTSPARTDARLLGPVSGIEERSGTLDVHTAFQQLQHSDTGVLLSDVPSLGFQQHPYWFLVPIATGQRGGDHFLVAGRPHTDYLDLYLLDQHGTIFSHQQHGDMRPWATRPFDDNELVFPVSLPPASDIYALFRMHTTGSLELPLALLSRDELYDYKQIRDSFTGLYFGAILAMALFNLLLFIAIRDHSYLLYVAYLLALVMFLLTRSSLAFEMFWPTRPELNDSVRVFSSFLSEGLAVLFASAFLQLSSNRPRWARAMQALGGTLLVAAVLSPFFPMAQVLKVATFAVVIIAPMLLTTVALRIHDGFRPARYFLLSFLPLAVLGSLFVLKTFAFIPSNWLFDHAFEIGSTLESLLLSFALAYRLTMLKSENERIQKEVNVELEKRVRERTEELNRALNARSEFLAVMSHEICTPLNGLLGTLDMLKDSPLNAEQRQKIHVIEQSGNTLVELINDILDYARIEAGRLPIDDEQFNLPGLIRESVALFEHRARINGDELRIELDDNLGLLCRGDPLRLRQIVVNLVSNAVKFTEGGKVVVHAKRDRDNPEYGLIEVVDEGIGIDRRQLGHLFELFQQGDGSTRRRYGGTGLGLAICRQLVELMGGEIGAESEPGKGSRFWFRLPLPEVSRDERRAEQHDDMTATSSPPVRLLIVDDNHVNLLVAQGLARKLGHDVEVAESGPEAIAVLLNDSRPFDLILMDCEMPGMDGFETSREILRLQSEGKIDEIPVVALTAHAVPDKIRQSHEAGMISHIAKPINSAKLDREIRSVLKHGNGQDNRHSANN